MLSKVSCVTLNSDINFHNMFDNKTVILHDHITTSDNVTTLIIQAE